MSKDQKGFVVYGDIEESLNELSDEQVANLFRGMVNYFNTGKEPKFTGLLRLAFIPIRQQMDRDVDKYEKKCQKNKENIQKYWDKVKTNTNEYERIQSNTNVYECIPPNTFATNTNTKTNTDTKTDTDTTTTTKHRGGGLDEEFNIWNQLGADGIDAVYEAYPNSGGFLLDAVHNEIKTKKKKVKSPLGYVLGYAKKVGWDDKAEHFEEVL